MKKRSIITILALVLMLVLMGTTLAACSKYKHEFSKEWEVDGEYHWHACLTEGHTDVADKEAHVFDKQVVNAKYLAAAATYTTPAKYYKSCMCGAKGKQTFESGSTLSAKDNVVTLKSGVTLNKTYDKTAVVITPTMVETNGDGAITVMYKGATEGDDKYTATAPLKAGSYVAKVSVAATAEWKAASKEVAFTIQPKALTASGSKEYDGTDSLTASTLDGVVEGDEVTARILMISKNVGTTVKGTELNGADKDNYVLPLESVSANIKTRKLFTSALESRMYDGTDILRVKNLKNVVSGEEVSAYFKMTSKNVGAIVREIVLEGADKANYEFPKANVDSVAIVPRTIEQLNLEIQFFNGTEKSINAQELNAANSDFLANDDISVSLTFANAEVGTVADHASDGNWWSNTGFTGSDKMNYDLTNLTVTATIVKCRLELTTLEFTRNASNPQVDGAYLFSDTETEVWLLSRLADVEVAGIYQLKVNKLELSDPEHYELVNHATDERNILLTVVNDESFYMAIREVGMQSASETILTGVVNAGEIEANKQLVVSGIDKTVMVKSINVTGGGTKAKKGDSVQLIVTGVKVAEVKPGMVVTPLPQNVAYDFEMDFTMSENAWTDEMASGASGTMLHLYRYKKPAGEPYTYEYVCMVNAQIQWEGAAMHKGDTRLVRVKLLIKAMPLWEDLIVMATHTADTSKLYGYGTITSVQPATVVLGTVTTSSGGTFQVTPIAPNSTQFTAKPDYGLFAEDDEVTITVSCDGKEIAKMTRTGFNFDSTSSLCYQATGGTLENDVGEWTFNFHKGVEGFTDANGKWICSETAVVFEVAIEKRDQLQGVLTIGEDFTNYGVAPNENYFYNVTLSLGWNRIRSNAVQYFKVFDKNGNELPIRMGELFEAPASGTYYVWLKNTGTTSIDVTVRMEKIGTIVTVPLGNTVGMPQGEANTLKVVKVNLSAITNPYQKFNVTLKKSYDSFSADSLKFYDEDFRRVSSYSMSYTETSGEKYRIYHMEEQNTVDKTYYIVLNYTKAVTATDTTLTVNRSWTNIKDITVGTASTQTILSKVGQSYKIALVKDKKYVINIAAEATALEKLNVTEFYNPAPLFEKRTDVVKEVTFVATATGDHYFTVRNENATSVSVTVTVKEVKTLKPKI